MKNMKSIFILMLLIGCSSSTTTPADCENSEDGCVSQENVGGAESGVGGNNEEAGGESSYGGTNQTFGGSNSIGGNIISANIGGSTSCVAKTCNEIAIEITGWQNFDDVSQPIACGFVNDGCGNLINCGSCPSTDTWTGCGESLYDNGFTYYPKKVANICGTRCVKDSTTKCGEKYGYENDDLWICPTGDVPVIGKINCNTISVNAFCCDAS